MSCGPVVVLNLTDRRWWYVVSVCVRITLQVLAWEYSITIWKDSFLFLGHIVTALVYVITAVLPKKSASKTKKA